MTKKYLYIIFTPVIMAVVNGYVSSYSFFSWGYDNRNSVSTFLFILSLIGCLYVIISNAKNSKSKSWFMVSGIGIVINIFIIYTIYSLSSFGF